MELLCSLYVYECIAICDFLCCVVINNYICNHIVLLMFLVALFHYYIAIVIFVCIV